MKWSHNASEAPIAAWTVLSIALAAAGPFPKHALAASALLATSIAAGSMFRRRKASTAAYLAAAAVLTGAWTLPLPPPAVANPLISLALVLGGWCALFSSLLLAAVMVPKSANRTKTAPPTARSEASLPDREEESHNSPPRKAGDLPLASH